MIPTIKGYRILIDPDPIKEKYEGTTLDLVKVETTLDGEKRNMQSGKVLQTGLDSYKKPDCLEKWCIPGDMVLFKRGAGQNYYDADDNDKLYIILNEEDVLGGEPWMQR